MHTDFSILYERQEYLSRGGSAVVYAIDEERVLKQYYPDCDGAVERRAYQRLGSHPHIAKYLGCLPDGSIVLERGQVLRSICQQPEANRIPLQTKLLWLKHAAEGYQHVHNSNIVHADVSCNNMILTPDNNLKIIDFEGCSMDGAQAESCYEWFSYRRSMPSTSKKTDIFAFGCAAYEIITGKPPYHELEKLDGNSYLVEQRYEQNQFPDVFDLPLEALMRSCWQGEARSMTDIRRQLEAFSPLPEKEAFRWRVRQMLQCFGLMNTTYGEGFKLGKTKQEAGRNDGMKTPWSIFSVVKAAGEILKHLLSYCRLRNL
ncbi:hypothetical protein MMC13_000905 [Lambiella insularis]|nr:hypothetical protein [Lambiella insularis]